MARLDRFLKLEKTRRGAPSPAPAHVERFESGDDAVAPPNVGEPSGRASSLPQRFGPPPEQRLRFAEEDPGQPFIRCCGCHFDNHKADRVCRHCGRDLKTEEQTSYNVSFWRQHLLDASDLDRRTELLRTTTTTAPGPDSPSSEIPGDRGPRDGEGWETQVASAFRWLATKVPNPRLRGALMAAVFVLLMALLGWLLPPIGTPGSMVVFFVLFVVLVAARIAPRR
jgi:hypothetical protein